MGVDEDRDDLVLFRSPLLGTQTISPVESAVSLL